MTARYGRSIVVFGDVVRSRTRLATGEWLEALTDELAALYKGHVSAAFDFTQGDELQGLLRIDADPFRAVLSAMLRPRTEAPAMRWVVLAGSVEPGRGPATRRTGPAFVAARAAIEQARHRRDGLTARSGEVATDALLDGTAPVLASLMDRLTDRQRVVARLALVDGLRQSIIAERLGVSRATVSVSFSRGDVRSLSRLLDAVRSLWDKGLAATETVGTTP